MYLVVDLTLFDYNWQSLESSIENLKLRFAENQAPIRSPLVIRSD